MIVIANDNPGATSDWVLHVNRFLDAIERQEGPQHRPLIVGMDGCYPIADIVGHPPGNWLTLFTSRTTPS